MCQDISFIPLAVCFGDWITIFSANKWVHCVAPNRLITIWVSTIIMSWEISIELFEYVDSKIMRNYKNCGWQEVRYVPKARDKWHMATDDLAGT